MLLYLVTDSLQYNAGSVIVNNAGMSVLEGGGAFAPNPPPTVSLSMSVMCGRTFFTQALTSTAYISKKLSQQQLNCSFFSIFQLHVHKCQLGSAVNFSDKMGYNSSNQLEHTNKPAGLLRRRRREAGVFPAHCRSYPPRPRIQYLPQTE